MRNSFNSESSISFSFVEEDTFPEIPNSLISTISSSLLKVISNNTNLLSYYIPNNPFTSNPIPSISIYDYLTRICHYTNLSKETLICALIYIDNICATNTIILNEFTIHKIILTSILLSIKYNEDQIYPMNYYAEIFGISVKELLNLELSFLSLIDFHLFIKDEIYFQYEQSIVSIKHNNDNDKQNVKPNEYENGEENEEEIYLNLSERKTMSSYNSEISN